MYVNTLCLYACMNIYREIQETDTHMHAYKYAHMHKNTQGAVGKIANEAHSVINFTSAYVVDVCQANLLSARSTSSKGVVNRTQATTKS